MALRACMFTDMPDKHSILDHHPRRRQVPLVSPCSGQGFEFCSVIGEILADLATGSAPPSTTSDARACAGPRTDRRWTSVRRPDGGVSSLAGRDQPPGTPRVLT